MSYKIDKREECTCCCDGNKGKQSSADVSPSWLETLWERIKEYISTIIHPAEKEIIPILTYAASAPSSAEEGDLYINYTEKKLYVYNGSAWEEEEPSSDVLYCTDDTNRLYLYVDESEGFRDVTGQGIIYVKNLTSALAPYTKTDIHTVCYHVTSTTIPDVYYTLVVNSKRVRKKVGTRYRYVTVYTQTLKNEAEYRVRTKEGSGSWSAWDVRTYAIKEEIMPLIYAGL